MDTSKTKIVNVKNKLPNRIISGREKQNITVFQLLRKKVPRLIIFKDMHQRILVFTTLSSHGGQRTVGSGQSTAVSRWESVVLALGVTIAVVSDVSVGHDATNRISRLRLSFS